MEYLVEASAAEAEAISATLAAAKARQVNGEVELPDRDCGAEATPSGASSLIKPDATGSVTLSPAGIRLHHRAVSVTLIVLNNSILAISLLVYMSPDFHTNTFLVYNGSGTLLLGGGCCRNWWRLRWNG